MGTCTFEKQKLQRVCHLPLARCQSFPTWVLAASEFLACFEVGLQVPRRSAIIVPPAGWRIALKTAVT
ncbi:hypothetical protein Y1Q_0023693 [Alligator mississippiensis]|uniref:Uncharacterized protein n=1 Tax=Alligator mississippiensis TaxID=8496 RepID=A0A151NBU0_ALLMI|nr:hypothetical protein Y1Q_0023693 [Alligator mississippiensis]